MQLNWITTEPIPYTSAVWKTITHVNLCLVIYSDKEEVELRCTYETIPQYYLYVEIHLFLNLSYTYLIRDIRIWTYRHLFSGVNAGRNMWTPRAIIARMNTRSSELVKPFFMYCRFYQANTSSSFVFQHILYELCFSFLIFIHPYTELHWSMLLAFYSLASSFLLIQFSLLFCNQNHQNHMSGSPRPKIRSRLLLLSFHVPTYGFFVLSLTTRRFETSI